MADDRAIIEQAYEDFARGDVPAVVALLDGDVHRYEAAGTPWWQEQPAVGPEQVVAQVSARIVEELDDFAVRLVRTVGCGDTVLAEVRCTGTGTGTATGLALDAQAAHVWDLRGGKVVRFPQYIDTAQLRRVLAAGS